MKINKITTVFFSPTGGTKAAADVVSGTFEIISGLEAAKMDITGYEDGKEHDSLEPDTLAVIAVPVYGGRVPDIAVQKLRNFWGDHTPAVMLAVYGNRDYDDALLELKNLISGYGFFPIAGISAVAEHSIMREYAHGRPDGADIIQLQDFAKQVWERLAGIEDIKSTQALTVPGNQAYREYKGVPLKPKAGRDCLGCGLCALKCPVRAISKEEPNKTDTEICISCMRCVAVCPNHARSVNRLKLAVAAKALAKACEKRKENELFLV